MKLGVILVVIGALLVIDGMMRLVLIGWPGITGFIFGVPCVYYGVRRIQRAKDSTKQENQ